MPNIQYLDWQEFRDGGYLQEVNRRFFHPLGLALEIAVVDETGEVTGLGGIWDYRSDPEGVIYGDHFDLGPKAQKIQREWDLKQLSRVEGLGYGVQPAFCPECKGDPGYTVSVSGGCAGPCQTCMGTNDRQYWL